MQQELILIIEDDMRLRKELAEFLEMNGYDVIAIEDESAAWDCISQNSISLILVEWNFISGNGELFCHEICKNSNIPVIIVSSIINEDSMLKGLRIGAEDYIFKPYSKKNIAARIEVVLRRYRNTQKNCYYDDGFLRFEPENRLIYKEGKEVHLTPTEYKLFDTMIHSSNQVFSRNQLITAALGSDYDGFDRSIDTYIKGLRSKIEIDRKNPKYIKTVHGVGYRFQQSK